jgi:glycosyltransferase involved in cell wall biosynthesis
MHPQQPPVQFAEHPNVQRHELRSALKSLSPLLTQQTGRPLLKGKTLSEVLRLRAYDVIHFHNISLLGPKILSIVPPRGQAVKMYTTHEHWLVCPTHVLWKFNRAPCEKPECLRCTIQAKRPPQLWRYTGLLNRMAAHIDQFLAPSRFTARMHAERDFRQPIAYLPNFVDRTDQDWLNPAPRPQATPYFLFVGRLERIKGLQTLIPLWARVPQYDLLVVGTGTYELELRAMAARNPRIKFLGPLPQRELGALYHHAIACIVPSITYETFGMISVEAFSRKTPVIARDLGALPEVVQDSGGGFVYRTDEELLQGMECLAASRRLRDDLGQKGYDGFVRWWCREAHLTSYFDYLTRSAERRFGASSWRCGLELGTRNATL